ncbi:MAG: DUF4388 domain-containing protein [Planctomycetota bacterium]|nr:MAG: DUF4388 domain-containing protein [Planctomycetota bacterium]
MGLILVIGEAREIFSRDLATKLANQSCKFIRALNKPTALQMIQEHKPDIVVVDLNFPDIHGLDLVEEIHKLDIPKAISFIFATSTPSRDERMKILFTGGGSYLEKPVPQDKLEEAIQKALQNRGRATVRITKKVTLKGNLASVPISDIFQMVANYQKSGALKIRKLGSPTIYFQEGMILDASWKEQNGLVALYKIIALSEGDFEFEEFLPTCKTAIEGDWMSLLMEGLRLKDEVNLLRTTFADSLGEEELLYLEEVIFRNYADRESLIPLIKNRQPGKRIGETLMEAGILKGEEEEEISSFIQKNFQPKKVSKKISLEEKLKSAASKHGYELKLTKSESGIKERIEEQKSGFGQKLSSQSSKTMVMRLSYISSKNKESQSTRQSIASNIFQRLLLALSLVTPEQMNECIQEQVRLRLRNIESPLEEILVNKNLISEEVVENLLHLKNEMGESLIPGYEVKRLIGEGGLASVYLAEDEEGKNFAVKVFAPPLSIDTSTSVIRFIRECEAIKSLTHPNIVEAYDFGEFYGLYYIVLEYLDGITLEEKIIKEGPLPEEEALVIIERVVEGLCKAWSNNFLHRDIKPGNIMIGDDFVKLCDFGLAKSLDSAMKLTQDGTIMGTPHYMAPEQFLAEELDFRADVYSLGVTLYVMLTAHLPFAGTTVNALQESHTTSPPPSPTRFGIKISKATKAFLFKLLSKRKEDRCKDLNEFLENLKRVRQGKYPKGGVVYYQQKRRKRALLAASTIALLAVLSFSIWYATREMESANKVRDKQIVLLKKKEEEEKKKREKEKMKIQSKLIEKQLKLKKELERLKRLKEQKEREKLAAQKKLQQQRENKILSGIKEVWLEIENLDLESAFDKVCQLEYNFPMEKKVIKLKKVVQNLQVIEEGLKKNNLLFIWGKVRNLDRDPKYRIYLYKMLSKYFLIYPVPKKKELFLKWLQLSKIAQKYLAIYLENELDKFWLKEFLLSFPEKDFKQFLHLLAENTTQKGKVFVAQIRASKRLQQILGEISTRYSEIETILRNYNFSPQEVTLLASKLTYQEKMQLAKVISILVKYTYEYSQTISFIISILKKTKDVPLRMLLAKNLGSAKNPICKPYLREMLKDPSFLIRMQVVESLSKQEDFSALEKASKDQEVSVRRKVIQVISSGKKRNSITIKIAVNFLDDSDSEIQKKALELLGKWRVKSAFLKILALLDSPDNEVVIRAIQTLGKFKISKAVPHLLKVIKENESEEIQREIIRALGKIKQKNSYVALVKILKDFPLLREETVPALSSADPSIVPLLLKEMEEGNAEEHIEVILKKMKSRAVPSICTYLKQTHKKSFQKKLIRMLGDIGSPKAVNTLIQILSKESLKYVTRTALKNIAKRLPRGDAVRIKIEQALQYY